MENRSRDSLGNDALPHFHLLEDVLLHLSRLTYPIEHATLKHCLEEVVATAPDADKKAVEAWLDRLTAELDRITSPGVVCGYIAEQLARVYEAWRVLYRYGPDMWVNQCDCNPALARKIYCQDFAGCASALRHAFDVFERSWAEDGSACWYALFSGWMAGVRARVAMGIDPTDDESPNLVPYCVNVRDLGAVGDGVYHCLAERFDSLAAARAEYPAASSLGESIDWAAIQKAVCNYDAVEIPCGVYHLGDRTIDIVRSVDLFGDGVDRTILIYDGEDAGIWVNSSRKIAGCQRKPMSFWVVRDLTVDGRGRGAFGLRLGRGAVERGVSANNGRVESVRLTGMREAGLHLIASQSNVLRDVYCHQNRKDGCRVDCVAAFFKDGGHAKRKLAYSTNTKFYDCHFILNDRHGVSAGSGVGFTFHGCLFEGNGGVGAFLVRGQGLLAYSGTTGMRSLLKDDIPVDYRPAACGSGTPAGTEAGLSCEMKEILKSVPARGWEFSCCWFEVNSRYLEKSEPSETKSPDWTPWVFAHIYIDVIDDFVGPWFEMSIRDCRLNNQNIRRGTTTARWGVVAGRCQLNIWFPASVANPIGTDTGDAQARVNIWDSSHPQGRRKCGGGWVLGQGPSFRSLTGEISGQSDAKILFHQINDRYYYRRSGEHLVITNCKFVERDDWEYRDVLHRVYVKDTREEDWRLMEDLS